MIAPAKGWPHGGKPTPASGLSVANLATALGKARGWPVGVALDQAGALLVTDDAGYAVWRAILAAAAVPAR